MSNLMLARRDAARTAIAAAQEFLLIHQDADGFWRDYNLPPGPSETWTTSRVGHALLRSPYPTDFDNQEMRRAARAVQGLRKETGWGYNRHTAADADSTAWAIRFLAASGTLSGFSATELLQTFLTESGSARTFQPNSHFGSWAGEHDEVTPLVGLALQAACAEASVVLRVREASLQSHNKEWGWRPFWWSMPAYAISCNLEFLREDSGIPAPILECESERLQPAPSSISALECALRLGTACHVRNNTQADQLLDALLALRLDDGSWPSSSVLRVPNQRHPTTFTLNGDDRRLFGTATAIAAIKIWMNISTN